ncbi:Papain cysteine protease family protein [Acanthocheilonema viteae]
MLTNCWIILLGLHAIVAFEEFENSDSAAEDDFAMEGNRDLLSLAMAEYNKIFDSKYWWIPLELLDISVIHDEGLFFQIKLALAPSNCTKVTFTSYNNKYCKAKKATDLKACTFRIFQRMWAASGGIQFRTCSDYVPSEKLNETNSFTSDAMDMNSLKSVKSVFDSVDWLESDMLTLWRDFVNFMETFKREYSSITEKLNRFKIYLQNMYFAQKLQHDEKGTAIYGATQFSDMTPEEFQKYIELNFNLNDFNLSLNHLPINFDWRTKGVVTPVKNQGSCGSCWAFSVTGNIEGLWAIKTGKLISLSEQELIDCDVVDNGCNGGLPINAFREIKRMGGLEPEDKYPYKGKNGTCHLVRRDIAVSIDDAVEIPRNETVMKAWIAQRGPLSVGIDAELLAYYKSGILHPTRSRCPPSRINHGVLITGYGIQNRRPYWIIKNSWGQHWGEDGYFRLMRGGDVCGVSDLVSSAIIH